MYLCILLIFNGQILFRIDCQQQQKEWDPYQNMTIGENIVRKKKESMTTTKTTKSNLSSRSPTTFVDIILDYVKVYRLPTIFDFLLSYTIGILCFLYYFYSYWKGHYWIRSSTSTTNSSICVPNAPSSTTMIPLVSERRTRRIYFKDMTRNMIQETKISIQYELVEFMQQYNTELQALLYSMGTGKTSMGKNEQLDKTILIEFIRNNSTVRRIVSKFMMFYNQLQEVQNFLQSTTTTNYQEQIIIVEDQDKDNNDEWKVHEMNVFELYQLFESIWIELLRLPPLHSFSIPHKDEATTVLQPPMVVPTDNFPFIISLIIPAYRETGESIKNALQRALQNCTNPNVVQVVIVHANNTCEDLHQHIIPKMTKANMNDVKQPVTSNDEEEPQDWGELIIVDHLEDSGRGPCLNKGAESSSGAIMTFLHSDIMMPKDWDTKIRKALNYFENSKNKESNESSSSSRFYYRTTTHACSFRYGIDTSKSALNNKPFPYGIGAVQLLGRYRACMCKLPYGDHVISIPSEYFWYLGGYPNQPLMEDYDFVDLLRKRARIPELNEQLTIIDGPPVLCSPRRWQQYGVTYVTALNGILVHRYVQGKLLPDEAFEFYYGKPGGKSSVANKDTTSTQQQKKGA